MKKLSCLLLVFLSVLFFVGCQREMNVKAVTSSLRIGMSKAELDKELEKESFIKVQTVAVHPGRTEEMTRAAVWSNKIYESVYPQDLVHKKLPFDGSVKAYAYLIKEERRFANPIDVEALFVFVDQKNGEVIGWADIRGLVEVRLWGDVF